jgi:HSP20 family molecular chaperone IbpA
MAVDEEFREMRKMISRMLQEAFEGKRHEPVLHGVVTPGSGATRSTKSRPVMAVRETAALPGPEIAVGQDEVSVTFDLGEASIAGVRTNLLGRLLYVDVEGPRPMRRVVHLPTDVEPAARWTIHNGVLDLILPRTGRAIAPP